MIDGSALAAMMIREAHLFAGSMGFPDEPELSVEQKIQHLSQRAPLPSTTQLAALIEPLFWASMQEEEGRPTVFRVLLRPRGERDEDYMPLLALNTPVPLVPRQVTKLCQAHDPRTSYLAVWFDGDEPFIHAIGGLKLTPTASTPDFFSIRSFKPGSLDVSWLSFHLARLTQGRIDKFSEDPMPRAGTHNWLLGVFPNAHDLQLLFDHLIASVVQHGHGGSIWVADSSRPFSGSIQVNHLIHRTGRTLIDEVPDMLARRTWAYVVGRLSAVDGAVLIDDTARVFGFGAFVNLRNDYSALRLTGGNPQLVPIQAMGGGRHRAGLTFCFENEPSAAAIVSEDGGISLVRHRIGLPVPEVISISPLGFEGNLRPL